MDHISVHMLLFVSFCQWMMNSVGEDLKIYLTFGTSVQLILCPTILSGSLALLVKYLIAVRILPVYKLVSGGMLLLLVSWYIDKICKNNAYLLVRFVGLGIIFCAVLGVVVVSEDRFADRRPRVEVETVQAGDYVVARD